jgi:hypothetical protein
MSHKTDAHHLRFNDYKFPLEDRAFLDKIAFMKYDGAGKSKRLTDAIRETLRILTAFDGFRANYSLTTSPSDTSKNAMSLVQETVTAVGQDETPFFSLHMLNGPLMLPVYLQPKKAVEGEEPTKAPEFIASPVDLIGAFDALFGTERSGDWWLGEDSKFQVATFLYEWRRVILDLPFGFHGHAWKDSHGVAHFFLTQAGELEFADDRLNLYLAVTLPSTFNGKVIEKEKELSKAEA